MTMIMSYNSNDALDKEFENEINDTFQDSLDKVIAMLNGDLPVDKSIVSTVEYLKNSLCDCKVNEIFDTAEYFCDFYDEGLQD
jgi:hypothetical protein